MSAPPAYTSEGGGAASSAPPAYEFKGCGYIDISAGQHCAYLVRSDGKHLCIKIYAFSIMYLYILGSHVFPTRQLADQRK